MKKSGIAVALGLTLAGCVSTGNEEFARRNAAVNEAYAACIADLNAKKFKSYVAYGQCLSNAEAPNDAIAGQLTDLQMLNKARRNAILEQVDRKQLTWIQAQAELAQLSVEMNSAVQSRINAGRAVAAQEQAAMAASDVAHAASRPVTCYRVAYLVNCL